MALKKSSSLIVIGANDNEVFVVQAIDLMLGRPDAVAGTDTGMQGTLTTTGQLAMPRFSSSGVMAKQELEIMSANATSAVSFTSGSFETPPTNLDYIGIISTNDFFLQVEGVNNTGAHNLDCKVYGYRARADAATYAALVQSEVLSAQF